MMALNFGGETHARLDAVGVDRSLGEIIALREFFLLGFEHIDEGLADDLAFLLGIGDVFEPL